ncbi:energy-coupling factor ABC transporter ATP-binding protein [Microbacterium sp.]|uniref:energy-coupling factor ABC transporter ATP-binding protein n=1 Tax=Microbacterium sp. TaxID=51671 RepID=UPI003A8E4778
MTSDAAPVLVADDLWFEYPTASEPALRGIDLAVREGEFIGIIGPSGAGKSTLCQALKGLIPHSTPGTVEGAVIAFGEDITDSPDNTASRRVGLVLQDPEAQIIGMSVAEDLAFGPENYEVDPDEIRIRAVEALAQVGLSEYMERDTYALSGGQKQRLAIASALMLAPDILILDEPTSELDPLGKDQVFEVISRLRGQRSVTVIVVEHEVERLAALADRILVMEHGKVIADGTPLEVFGRAGARERAAGERLPAAADLVEELREVGGRQRELTSLSFDELLDTLHAELAEEAS